MGRRLVTEPDAIFEPVSREEDPQPSGEQRGEGEPSPIPDERPSGDQPSRVEGAKPDPFPLAGPILENARSEILRGRCSSCDSRIRVQLEEPDAASVRVRCSICGHTRRVQL